MQAPPSSAYAKPPPALESPTWVRHVVVGQWGRVYAEALQYFCRQTFPNATITIACSGADIMAALYAQRADVLLLAMIFPDVHGSDLLARIASEKLAVRVLVAAHHRDERCLLALRDAPFDGLIDTQEEGTDTLVKALRMVAAGIPFVSPVFRDTVIDRDPVGVIWQKLTPAEIRVFSMVGDGSGNEEVARELGLSEATVQTHRRNLMHKLGISSSAKLVREAIRLGVVRITSAGTVIRTGLQLPPVHHSHK